MKFYLRGIALFLGIFLLLSSLIWYRYQNLYASHLDLRNATFHSTYDGIVNTFRLVSQTIAEEILLQDEVTRLVHSIVNTQGNERNHYRGLLFRKLSSMYSRISQHSIRQLHFHFPDGRSLLRFHAPHKADDDLTFFRPSVRIANQERREVHGYESGRIVHGFRHVYPLYYRGESIGSVEISNSFQQIYKELIKHVSSSGSQYHFIMLKIDLWHKLSTGQKELYHPSQLSEEYLCENSLADSFNKIGGTVMMTEEMRNFQKHLRKHPDLTAGIASGEDFALTTRWQNKVYSVLFHSIKNIDGHHAAYILSITPERYLLALRSNFMMQLAIAALFAAILAIFRVKLLRARDEQQSTTEFLQTLTGHIGEGLYATDRQGKITFFNAEASHLLGYPAEESLGKNAHQLFHINDPQHQDKGCPILNAILNNDTYEQQQHTFQPKQGNPIPVQLTCTPILKKGEITGTITLFHDISLRHQQERELAETQRRLQKANRHLARLAHIDGLTKVANRRLFDQVLVNFWKTACRHQTPLSILMLDIDYFKAYNDTYGHLQGDECLRVVAEVIQSSCLRPEDFAARYGGEEFAVLLPNTDLTDASHIAQRIQDNLMQQKIAHSGSPLGQIITLSIGVCSLQPDRSIKPQVIIDCADRRLYHAKQSGRNQTCNNDPEDCYH